MFCKISFVMFTVSYLTMISAHENTGNKTVVSIYYETYCNDSIKFFVKQFYPAYVSDLHPYIIVDAVPYGNAKTNISNGTYTFECEHGSKECEANKVHACVLNLPSTILQQDKLKFINCSLALVNPNSPTYPTAECAQIANISVELINKCTTNTTESNTYLKQYGDRTAVVANHGSVPFVAINGVFTNETSTKLVYDFVNNFCKMVTFNSSTPQSCKSNNNSASSFSLTVLPVILLSIIYSIKMYIV